MAVCTTCVQIHEGGGVPGVEAGQPRHLHAVPVHLHQPVTRGPQGGGQAWPRHAHTHFAVDRPVLISPFLLPATAQAATDC